MATKKKQLDHIQVKDNGIKLSQKIGDTLGDSKTIIQNEIIKGLLIGRNETNLTRYRISQNNQIKAFKVKVDKLIGQTKKTVKTALNSDTTVNLTNNQVKTMTNQINKGLLFLEQSAIQQYQNTVRDVVLRCKTAGDLKEQLQRHIDSGVNIGVVYKDGKQFKFDSYWEMKTRTDIQQDIGKNMVDTGSALGVIFYIAAYFGDCAKDHVDYQGKIYVDRDWKSNAPKDRIDEIQNYIDSKGIKTVQEVMDGPAWFTTRPNCRHYFQYIDIDSVLGAKTNNDVNKLREDMNLNYNGKYRPEKYAALQQQRLNERKIRDIKNQIDVLKINIDSSKNDSSPVDVIKINNNLINLNKQLKNAQQNQKELIKQYDNLERRYDREKTGTVRTNLGITEPQKPKVQVPDPEQAIIQAAKELLKEDYEEFKQAVKNKTIVIDKIAPAQNKHIPGTNEYKTATSNGRSKSIITFDPEKLLNSVKNAIIRKENDGQFEGYIKFNMPIGRYINKAKEVDELTSIAIIKFSNKGVHFVPVNPRKDVVKWLRL